MINTLRAEWIKLRTITVHWMMVIIAVGFPVVVTTLMSIFGQLYEISAISVAELIVGLMVVSAMLLGTTHAIGLTSEYTHNTIRPTYAATPTRVKVLSAKLILATVVSIVVAIVTVVACWAVASLILSSRGVDGISLRAAGVLTQLIGAVVLSVLVSWFGFALGLIVRNSPATIAMLLLWPLLIENLVSGLFYVIGWENARRYLPYQAAIEATINANEYGNALGRPMGQIYFGAVALGLVAIGMALDHRRDA